MFLKPNDIVVRDNKITELSCNGALFIGWNTSSDGSGKAYKPGAAITLNLDMVLCAQWNALAALSTLGTEMVQEPESTYILVNDKLN